MWRLQRRRPVRLACIGSAFASDRAVQGDYQVKLQAKDNDGEELFCMLVDFTIKPPSFSSLTKSIREAV